MRSVSLRFTVCVLGCLSVALVARGQALTPHDTDRSTGQIESIVVDLPETLPAKVALTFPEDGKPILQDGKVSPGKPELFAFTPPAGRMFEVRLFAQSGGAFLVVYRGDSKTPTVSTNVKDRATMYLSSANGEELRILVLADREGETSYKLGVKLHPKESD
jgi:hypothetical protein